MKLVSTAASTPGISGNGSFLSAVERHSTHEIYRFKKEFVDLLAEHFGGHTTLNHLRVGNYIGLRSQYEIEPTSNGQIAQALGLSRATVSRIVSDFIQCGWVRETSHPDDGRKRLLVITPDHQFADRFERAFRRSVNELVDSFVSGKIVMVDPEKKSF